MSQPTSVIHFNCASCHFELAVPVELAGVTGPCPNCGHTITSPTLEQHQQSQAQTSAIPTSDVPSADGVKTALPPQRATASPSVSSETPSKATLPPPRPNSTVLPPSGALEKTSQESLANLPSEKEALTNELAHEPVPTGLRSRPQWDDHSTGVDSKRRHAEREIEGPTKPKRWINVLVFVITMLVMLACLGIFYSDAIRVKFYEYMRTQQAETEARLSEEAKNLEKEAPQNAPSGAPKADRKVEVTPEKTSLPNAASLLDETAPKLPLSPIPSAPQSSSVEVSETPQPSMKSNPALEVKQDQAPLKEGSSSSSAPVNEGASKTPKVEEISIKRALPVDDGPIAESDIVISAKPEVQEAVEAIKQFCAAPTWEERAKYVQHEEGVRPMMQRFYEVNEYTRVNLGYIDLLYHEPDTKDGELPHAVFRISGAGLSKPVPVMAELGERGWKIDWLAFTEFSEDLLERFMSDFVDSPTRFRVMIRRKTYFGDAKLKTFDSFEVTPPVPGFEAYVFCEKDSEISKTLNREVPWNRPPVAVTAELRWRQEGEIKWVEIVSIPQLNWKNPGTRKAVSAE